MNKITVVIPCYNNEDLIEECLKSVQWADEILICDSFSTDKTLAIAKTYTDKIIQHTYVNAARQKNWAIPQASNQWILIVDSDERISEELKKEIQDTIKNSSNYNGFKIPRANFSFGRHLKHGGYWPDWQLRLFKKHKGKYKTREVHEHMLIEGEVGCLKNAINHFPDRGVAQIVEKFFLRYAKLEAKERLKKESSNLLKLVFFPALLFIKRYILKRGFLDGVRGFIAAFLWSIYIFLTYLYMWRWKENE